MITGTRRNPYELALGIATLLDALAADEIENQLGLIMNIPPIRETLANPFDLDPNVQVFPCPISRERRGIAVER